MFGEPALEVGERNKCVSPEEVHRDDLKEEDDVCIMWVWEAERSARGLRSHHR